MACISTQSSRHTRYAAHYNSLFQGYADYLVQNCLYPTEQLSTSDADGPAANQTNLAIKAAVGLTAFASLTGQQNYTTTGQLFAKSIYYDGLGTDRRRHILLFSMATTRPGL